MLFVHEETAAWDKRKTAYHLYRTQPLTWGRLTVRYWRPTQCFGEPPGDSYGTYASSDHVVDEETARYHNHCHQDMRYSRQKPDLQETCTSQIACQEIVILAYGRNNSAISFSTHSKSACLNYMKIAKYTSALKALQLRPYLNNSADSTLTSTLMRHTWAEGQWRHTFSILRMFAPAVGIFASVVIIFQVLVNWCA